MLALNCIFIIVTIYLQEMQHYLLAHNAFFHMTLFVREKAQ